MTIPPIRLSDANQHPIREDGEFVLYWMIAFRRGRFTISRCSMPSIAPEQLGKPLVIFEPLRVRYRWASDRLHRFVIEGMRDNSHAFAQETGHLFSLRRTETGSRNAAVASPRQASLHGRHATSIPVFFCRG